MHALYYVYTCESYCGELVSNYNGLRLHVTLKKFYGWHEILMKMELIESAIQSVKSFVTD